MGWDVTADLDKFEEAIDWFLARTIIPAHQRRRLVERAKPRAFWISGVAQLSVVQDVFDQIRKALDNGEPYQDFKRRVRQQLGSAWGGDNPPRIETIFRNAVQSSYNAGRFRQMNAPSVARLRPYWMYDAILDSRTSPYCRPIHKTILPADHPFWNTHVPPLHHRCRSSIRALRTEQAEQKGISPNAPPVEPQAGFGRAPDDTLEVPAELRPAPSTEPALRRELEQKSARRPEPNAFELDPSFTIRNPANVQRKMRELFGRELSPDEIRSLVGIEPHLQAGHRYSLSAERNNLAVLVTSRDAAGNKIEGVREYYRDERGRLTVHHALLVIDDAIKGNKLGKKILQSQFRAYRALGVRRVVLEAAWDGQYVWPRMGFRLRDPGRLSLYQNGFERWLRTQGFSESVAKRIAQKPKDLHELAVVKYRGRALGKEYLFPGRLDLIPLEVTLDPSDPDFGRVSRYLDLDGTEPEAP